MWYEGEVEALDYAWVYKVSHGAGINEGSERGGDRILGGRFLSNANCDFKWLSGGGCGKGRNVKVHCIQVTS